MNRDRRKDPIISSLEERARLNELNHMQNVARIYGVHIDAAVNPFISKEDRFQIVTGQQQDPEYD